MEDRAVSQSVIYDAMSFSPSGIVKKDPMLPKNMVMPPLSPRAEGSVFDDEDKSKVGISLETCRKRLDHVHSHSFR